MSTRRRIDILNRGAWAKHGNPQIRAIASKRLPQLQHDDSLATRRAVDRLRDALADENVKLRAHFDIGAATQLAILAVKIPNWSIEWMAHSTSKQQ
jgi:hypothetical protein